MAKAIPLQNPRQADSPHSEAVIALMGPSFNTHDCGYSVVGGFLYDHLAADFWVPGDPLLVWFDTDYRALVGNIRRCRLLLRRELQKTISPRRKRHIRAQRDMFRHALFIFDPLAELCGELGSVGVSS